MIPAFRYPDKVWVVVLPLVALQQGIIQKCTRRGVDAVECNLRYTAEARVVDVSVEHGIREEYRTFLK